MKIRLEDTPIRLNDQGQVIPGATHNELADQADVFLSDLELHRPDLYAEHRQMLEECIEELRKLGDQPI